MQFTFGSRFAQGFANSSPHSLMSWSGRGFLGNRNGDASWHPRETGLNAVRLNHGETSRKKFAVFVSNEFV